MKTSGPLRGVALSLLWTVSCHAVVEPFDLPVIAHPERLASWRAGVAAADAQERPLQMVCIGDSNTENPAYASELRRLLQGCYGERGIGYHSLGNRNVLPESPKIERKGTWEFLRDAPKGPPPPRFALDGIWCQSSDPNAEVSVEFVFGSWEKPDYQLARPYNLQHRVRIHHQVGPGLGSFAVSAGASELRRVDCGAERPGYVVTEAFLCDGFRIAGLQGKVVLFGFDAERASYLQGQPILKGGVLVHALGKGWGRTEEPALVEESAYAAFFGAVRPDLITILLGTNDQHNDGRVSAYRDWLTTILRKLRTHAPEVGVLVIACPEAGQTKPGLAVQFRDAALEVAEANGAAFWSLQDVVGARAAVWTREGFFGDGLHYNAIGGCVIARMLLRQLGFDLNDLRHYPVLREAAQTATGEVRPEWRVRRVGATTLDKLGEALSSEPSLAIWENQARIADVRLAVAGESLAVLATVRDGQCAGPREAWKGGSFELCVANPANIARVKHNEDGPVVRQVAFPAVQSKEGQGIVVKQFTMDEKNVVVPWEVEGGFESRVVPFEPFGYELRALIPLDLLVLKPDSPEFLLECAVFASADPGTKPAYSRMFATRQDAGAFRDASLSARVRVVP